MTLAPRHLVLRYCTSMKAEVQSSVMFLNYVFTFNFQIDMETVAKMGSDNAELGQFLCIGDRLALRDFCTRQRSSQLESARARRKRRCYESIRKKMKQIDQPSSDESEEEIATKSTKLKGNRNASKPVRAIEFGWYHNGTSVRKVNGGGTRSVSVPKGSTEEELLNVGRNLFFPNGVSRRGVDVKKCSISICDFAHETLPENATVGGLCEATKMTGKLRFFLYSEGPEMEKKTQKSKPRSSAEPSTSTPQHKDDAHQTPKESPVAVADEFDQEIEVDECHWYPENDSEIQFGPLLMPTNLSDTIPLELVSPHSHSPTVTPTSQSPPHSPRSPTPPPPEPSNPPVTARPATVPVSGTSQTVADRSQAVSDGYPLLNIWCGGPSGSATAPLNDVDQLTGKRVVKLHRVKILSEMIEVFKEPSIEECMLEFQFVGEVGADVSGVSRDVYTAFWQEFYATVCSGEATRAPLMIPEYGPPQWEAIGRILVKGFKDVRVFPSRLSQAFVVALIHGEAALTQEKLLESYMVYVSDFDREILEKAWNGAMEDDDEEYLLDILSRAGSRNVPNDVGMHKAILKAAHKQLIMDTNYGLVWMVLTARLPLMQELPTVKAIEKLYDNMKPTPRKVIALINSTPQNQEQHQALSFLK